MLMTAYLSHIAPPALINHAVVSAEELSNKEIPIIEQGLPTLFSSVSLYPKTTSTTLFNPYDSESTVVPATTTPTTATQRGQLVNSSRGTNRYPLVHPTRHSTFPDKTLSGDVFVANTAGNSSYSLPFSSTQSLATLQTTATEGGEIGGLRGIIFRHIQQTFKLLA